LNGPADSLVGGATAEIAGHGGVDLLTAGVWVFRKKRRGLHDLAGLTVPALGNLLRNPRTLDRMAAIRGEAFDRGYLFAPDCAHGRQAGADRLTIDVDRASAAHPHPAAIFCARQAERVP
jgi:hypothetical protein